MNKWIGSIGYVVIASGVVILTPLGDLLPVGLLTGWLPPADDSSYFKIVATILSYTPTVVLVGLGLIVLLLGKILASLRGK